MKQYGSLSLADYPYDQHNCAYPSEADLARGTDFRIEDYQTVDFSRLDQVKGQLSDGNPVIIRIVPDETFRHLVGQAHV